MQQDLIQEQIKLEEEMSARGVRRFLASVAAAQGDGREEETVYGQRLVAVKARDIAAQVDAWKEDLAQGNARKHGVAWRLIREMDSLVLAATALRCVMSTLSNGSTYTACVIRIGKAVQDEGRGAALLAEIGGGKLSQIVRDRLRQASSLRNAQQYLRATVDRYAEWEEWTPSECIHVGGLLLDMVVAVTGIVTIVTRRTSPTNSTKHIEPHPDVLAWVSKSVEAARFLSPIYEPMVVPPVPWTAPEGGGYLTPAIRPLKLVKGGRKGFNEELAHAEMPVVYEAINVLQDTPWQVNREVLEVMREGWEVGAKLPCFPPKDALEPPPKPLDIDTNEEARRQWRFKASGVHAKNRKIIGRRIAFAYAVDCAERYKEYPAIYFPHQLDFRSRVYAVTTLCPQGADHTKALLRLAEGKPIGDRGITWLAIHGGNLIKGLDKEDFQARVDWIEAHTEEIVACADDPFTNRGWAGHIDGRKVDKPWQFLAFCFEWRGVVRNGEAHVTHLPIALDGTCSGLQHFSAMLRDEIGGKAVNLVPSEVPADVYSDIAAAVNELLLRDAERPDTMAHAEEWIAFGVNRGVVKRPVMTLAYGSKTFGFASQLLEDTIEPTCDELELAGEPTPWQDNARAANYLASLIWEAVRKTLVKAAQAMEWLQDVARVVARSDKPVTWETPLGFLVQQGYREADMRTVKLMLGTRRVTLVRYREEIDKISRRKQASSVAPNFVHACDASHLMLTVVRANQEGIKSFAVIHDSFGTLAPDTDKLFTAIREAMVELYSTVDVLGRFAEDAAQQVGEKLAEKIPPQPTQGKLELTSILDSNYCFS